MKNAHQFGQNPASRSIHSGGIEEIWINITPDMAYATIVSNFIQGRKHSRDKNAKAPISDAPGIWRYVFKGATRRHHIFWLRGLSRNFSCDCAANYRIDHFAEFPTI